MPEFSLAEQRSRTFWLLLSIISGVWCVLVLALQFSLPSLEPRVYFLDVGQGDAAFIITASYQKILVDGGPDRQAMEQINKILPFWDRTIDALLLSHQDSDHLRGFLPIISRFKVRNLYLGLTNDLTPQLQELIRLVSDKGSKITLLQAERDLSLDSNMALDILSPEEKGPTLAKNRNDASLVFKLLTPQSTALFTGDISRQQEKVLWRRYGNKLQSSVLKVPHHGSKTSSSSVFLAAVQPQQAIISVGENNLFGHPHGEVTERLRALGIPAYRTDLCGTIEVKLTKKASLPPAC